MLLFSCIGASLCNDKQMTSKCEQWERQGLCTRSAGWKQYMEENCAKTCRFCGSSGKLTLTDPLSACKHECSVLGFLPYTNSLLEGKPLSGTSKTKKRQARLVGRILLDVPARCQCVPCDR